MLRVPQPVHRMLYTLISLTNQLMNSLSLTGRCLFIIWSRCLLVLRYIYAYRSGLLLTVELSLSGRRKRGEREEGRGRERERDGGRREGEREG